MSTSASEQDGQMEKRSLDDIQNDYNAAVGHAPYSIRQMNSFCKQENHPWKYSQINGWWPTRPDPQSKPEEKPVNEGEYKAKMLEEQVYFVDGCCLIKTCTSIKRICLALNFFKTNSTKEDAILEYFAKYIHILNDYGHIIYDHLNGDHHSFEMIFDEITKQIQCNVSSCAHVHYYHKHTTNTLQKDVNLEYVFYVNLMRKIHSHLLHSYDCGIYLRASDSTEIETLSLMDHDMDCIEQMIHDKTDRVQIVNAERMDRYCTQIPTNESKSEPETVLHSFAFDDTHRFYYCEQYQNNYNEDIEYNIGYKYYEWYIRPHFSGLKSEMMDKLSIKCYQYTLKKVQKLMETEHMKAIKSTQTLPDCNDTTDCTHHIFTWEHLLSIVLFTDYHDLSQQLRQSFIKTESEPDISLKDRHSFYVHWARLLRESVEVFGDKTSLCPSSYHMIDTLPFIDSFNIRLNAPLSTTSQLSVAMMFNHMFTKDLDDTHGIVVHINGTCFNCAFVSAYGIENETIYFGGSNIKIYALKVFNKVVNKWQNYEDCIKALDVYESVMIGDVSLSSHNAVTEREYNIVSTLALCELGVDLNRIYPTYIHELFHMYCQRKNTVIIDLSHTNHVYHFLQHLRSVNYSDLLLPLDQIAALYMNCETMVLKRRDEVIVVFDSFFKHVLSIVDEMNETKLMQVTVRSVYIKCTEEILTKFTDALLNKQWTFTITKHENVLNNLVISRC